MTILETMDGVRHDLTRYGIPLLKVAPVDIVYNSENVVDRPGRNRTERYHGIRKLQLRLLVKAIDEMDTILLRDRLAEILDGAEDFYIYEQVSQKFGFQLPGESGGFKDHLKWTPLLYKRWRVERINNDAIEWNGLKGTRVVEFETSELPYAVSPYSSLEMQRYGKEWDANKLAWGMGFDWDENPPNFTFTANNFVVTNYGNVKVNPRYMPLKITLKGSFGSYVQIENRKTGEIFRYNGALSAGDTLILDGINATKNGVFITGATNKKLITLDPKDNQFVITGGTVTSIAFDYPFIIFNFYRWEESYLERFPLHDILSPLSYEERKKVQENWNRISAYLNGLQSQINILGGNEEVDVLLQRIQDAITNAETTTSELAGLIEQLKVKLIELQTAITNANDATDDANTLNVALTRLKGELEALQTNLNSIVQTEAQRVANESNRVTAEQGRVTAESSRVTSETARETAEQERLTAEQGRVTAEQNRVTTFDAQMLTAEQKITMMQYLIDNLASYNYDPDITFEFPNLIKWNGSTFIALQSVKGVTPVDDGVNYRLVAQRGVDGTGSVSSVNGMGPDENGNVEVIMALVNNLVSDSTTAGLTAAQGKALKVLLDGLQQAFTTHVNAMDNPHQVTAEQLALGNVQNYGVATQAEAEAGTANNKYMTPQRVKQSFDKNITTFSNSLGQLETQVNAHLDQSKMWLTASVINQIIPNGAFTQVMSAEVINHNGANFGAIVNSRLSLKKGVYLVFASVGYEQNANGMRRLALSASASTTNAVANGLTFNNLATLVQIDADNTLLAVDTYQDSGNALTMTEAILKVIKVGDLV